MMKHPKGFKSSRSGNLNCDMYGWLWNPMGEGSVLLLWERIPIAMGTPKGNLFMEKDLVCYGKLCWHSIQIFVSMIFFIQLSELHCVWGYVLSYLCEKQMSWKLGVWENVLSYLFCSNSWAVIYMGIYFILPLWETISWKLRAYFVTIGIATKMTSGFFKKEIKAC